MKATSQLATANMTAFVTLRAPTTTGAPSAESPAFEAPSIDWLSGTWHVTHSTLPMWKKARNVTITYEPIANSSSSSTDNTPKLNDIVKRQGLTGDKVKSIVGIDKAAGKGAWDWRGKGLLKIASSHWEVLGYGILEAEDGEQQWMVTCFAKTLFTPVGVDIYSRKREGLSPELIGMIKGALAQVDAEDVKKLASEIFEVKSDYY